MFLPRRKVIISYFKCVEVRYWRADRWRKSRVRDTLGYTIQCVVAPGTLSVEGSWRRSLKVPLTTFATIFSNLCDFGQNNFSQLRKTGPKVLGAGAPARLPH